MASIHAANLVDVGLNDLGKHEGYIERQLKRWYGQWNAQKTRDLPAVDRVHDELLKRIPPQGPATLVHGDDDIMLITDRGVLVRTRVSEIREMGRATQGVTLIGLDEGAKLSGMQRIVENDAQAGADDANEDGANEDGASDAAPDDAA